MKKKLVAFNLIIITLSLLVLFLSGLTVSKKTRYEEAEKNIIALTKVYVANYNDHVAENVPSGVRVTVVNEDGTVIADSRDASVVGKPHADREEIIAAFGGKPVIVTRRSASLGKDFVYYAEKAETAGGTVAVRVSIPVEDVNSYVGKTVTTTVWVLISALFLSYIASVIVTGSVIKPLEDVKKGLENAEKGVKTDRVPTGDAEIDGIMTEIDTVAEQLSSSVKAATDEKERLDYILSNVSDGIVVLDCEGTVRTANKVAGEVFAGSGYVGKNYTALTDDENFLAAAKLAVTERKGSETDYETDGKTYMVSVKPVDNGCSIIVATDITAVRRGEKMRGEFFADASHELKTPLTAIKGFNDLISLKTSDEEIKKFTAKTDKEINRILALLSDMLDLSKLESQKEINAEKVSLGEVAAEVKESLSGMAEKKKITVTADGDATIEIEREHAVELIKNLVENGVRYGNDGGFVKVKISDEGDGKFSLSVEDDGIGIEEKDKARLFERFYRVNKSRSRESGGTGLGLAIVKHICQLYGFDLSLTSTYGAGTTVVVKTR